MGPDLVLQIGQVVLSSHYMGRPGILASPHENPYVLRTGVVWLLWVHPGKTVRDPYYPHKEVAPVVLRTRREWVPFGLQIWLVEALLAHHC